MLDVEENLHLALHANARNDPHACMTYLKEALRQEPQNALAIYLLATQHAQVGLYARAVRGMQSALELNPKLDLARFQLGLLLLDRNERSEARRHFVMLNESTDLSLRSFAQGLQALADQDTL